MSYQPGTSAQNSDKGYIERNANLPASPSPQSEYLPISSMSALLWPNDSSLPVEATCLDFNAKGILLNTSEKMKVGDKVVTSMYSSQSKNFLVSYDSQIIRCVKSRDGSFLIGLEILKN